ncbi:sigma factor-like helix-turn-helix DNA-binding protein [Sphingomonas sp.]|uniref:sigma-70 region 4 domain-containing protein n=1 Tax=Sphingomonas sp. TaxID=28214 RepID=UPI003B00896C
MTEQRDPALVARAKAAFERTISNDLETIEPTGPEELARLERAMRALPRTTREIFLARRLDDYSYAKIAQITGLSVRQVERHMVKAIRQLGRYARGDERTAWQRWWQSHRPRWFR